MREVWFDSLDQESVDPEEMVTPEIRRSVAELWVSRQIFIPYIPGDFEALPADRQEQLRSALSAAADRLGYRLTGDLPGQMRADMEQLQILAGRIRESEIQKVVNNWSNEEIWTYYTRWFYEAEHLYVIRDETQQFSTGLTLDLVTYSQLFPGNISTQMHLDPSVISMEIVRYGSAVDRGETPEVTPELRETVIDYYAKRLPELDYAAAVAAAEEKGEPRRNGMPGPRRQDRAPARGPMPA